MKITTAIRADERRSAAAKQEDEAEVRARANALMHALGRAHEAGSPRTTTSRDAALDPVNGDDRKRTCVGRRVVP